jgi:hypothetical protein
MFIKKNAHALGTYCGIPMVGTGLARRLTIEFDRYLRMKSIRHQV